MKKISIYIVLGALAVILPSFQTRHPAAVDQGFALVELFTSEGCSSCPAADEAVGRINFPGKNVMVLSYHVDYWNYLGWKDIYSSPAYSARQQAYGNLFHLSSIYTPQIVVNGRIQFVGSDENRLHEAIEASVKEIPKTRIQPVVLRPSHGQIPVSCVVPVLGDIKLNWVLVQHQATDFIQRGENKGRTLHHYFIVRDFKSLPADKSTDMQYLQIPADISVADCSVIAFLQNSKTGQVLDAVRSDIPQ
jgi:hypothetical protein